MVGGFFHIFLFPFQGRDKKNGRKPRAPRRAAALPNPASTSPRTNFQLPALEQAHRRPRAAPSRAPRYRTAPGGARKDGEPQVPARNPPVQLPPATGPRQRCPPGSLARRGSPGAGYRRAPHPARVTAHSPRPVGGAAAAAPTSSLWG